MDDKLLYNDRVDDRVGDGANNGVGTRVSAEVNDRIKETIETYNVSAKAYQDKFMEMNLYDDTYDTFCHLIHKSGASILEIGTGPGNVIKYILGKCPDFKVFGIDLSPNMIELAKQNNPQAEFSVMDCRDIRMLDAKFDGILCAFCLPYLSKEESIKLISDASLLLEPDGVLYISTMEGDYNKSGYETTSFSGGNRVFVYYHQADLIATCLMELGFEILDLRRKQYPEPDGSFLTDMIFIARKIREKRNLENNE